MMLKELKSHLIKSDGKMKNVVLKPKYVELIKEIVLRYLENYKEKEKIYLPLAWPINGFGGLAVLLKSIDPNNYVSYIESVRQKLTSIIFEMSVLESPILISKIAIEACSKVYYDTRKLLLFANKFLAINKPLTLEIIDILIRKKAIQTIDTIEKLISNDVDYYYIFDMCRHVDVRRGLRGDIKHSNRDTVAKRIHALARFYDNFFVLTGAAIYEGRRDEEQMEGRRRGGKSYTLYISPFTKSLKRAIEGSIRIDEYIEAYLYFVTFIINRLNRMSKDKRDEVVEEAKDILSKYKHIDVLIDDDVIRSSVDILYSFILSIRK